MTLGDTPLQLHTDDAYVTDEDDYEEKYFLLW